MAVTPLKLFHDTVPSPEAAVYTSPGGVVLRKLIVVNIGSLASVSVSVAGKRVLVGRSVAVNSDPVQLVLSVPLDVGDTVTALTSVANQLVILGTGWTY